MEFAMAELMGNLRRTAYCGTLGIENVNDEVIVAGWVQKRRNLGSLIFIDLRDKTGIVQAVFDDTVSSEVFEKANAVRSEYVVLVKGVVRERENKTDKIKTGAIEILAKEVSCITKVDRMLTLNGLRILYEMNKSE